MSGARMCACYTNEIGDSSTRQQETKGLEGAIRS